MAGEDWDSIEVGTGVSRREVLNRATTAGVITATPGLAGCTGTPPADAPTSTPTQNTRGARETADLSFSRHPAVAPPGWDPAKTVSGDGRNERTALFIGYGLGEAMYAPLVCGFHDALNVFGWRGQFMRPNGPNVFSPGFHARVIRDESEELDPGDVIVTPLYDNQVYNDALQTVLDNDVVVINAHERPASDPPYGRAEPWTNETMTEDIGFTYRDQPMIIPHVGIDHPSAGVALAAEAHDRLRRKLPDQEEYAVLLVNALRDDSWASRRIDKTAAAEGTAQRYFETQDDVTIHEAGTDEVIRNVSANIPDARGAIVETIQGEGVDAVVDAAVRGAVGAGRALDEGDLEAPMVIGGFETLGGFEFLAPLVEAIDEGHVDFALSQDFYSQGFQPVPLAWMYLERGIPMKTLEWGVSVWDAENIAFVRDRGTWGELLNWQKSNYDGDG